MIEKGLFYLKDKPFYVGCISYVGLQNEGKVKGISIDWCFSR